MFCEAVCTYHEHFAEDSDVKDAGAVAAESSKNINVKLLG